MNKPEHIHKIENGTVIDHIRRGFGRKILQLIGATDDVIVMGINLNSSKYKKKDILKFANRLLTETEKQLIAALSPEATISIIKNWSLLTKESLTRPDVITGILKCPNPKCITNYEQVTTVFLTHPKIQCSHCERSIKPNEFIQFIK